MVPCLHSLVRASFSMDQSEIWNPVRKEVKLGTCKGVIAWNTRFVWYVLPKFEQLATRNVWEFWITLSPGRLLTFLLYCLRILFMYVTYFLCTIAKRAPNPIEFRHSSELFVSRQLSQRKAINRSLAGAPGAGRGKFHDVTGPDKSISERDRKPFGLPKLKKHFLGFIYMPAWNLFALDMIIRLIKRIGEDRSNSCLIDRSV